MHLPVEFIFISTIVLVTLSFIFGWKHHLRWVGALIMITLTLFNFLLLLPVAHMSIFDIDITLVGVISVILYSSIYCMINHFKEDESNEN